MCSITLSPITDKLRIVRERVVQISNSRDDRNDVTAQLCLLIGQLRYDKFTGEVTLNFGQGTIRNVNIRENVKAGSDTDK